MGNEAVAHVLRACGAMNFEDLSSMLLGCGEGLQGTGSRSSVSGNTSPIWGAERSSKPEGHQ